MRETLGNDHVSSNQSGEGDILATLLLKLLNGALALKNTQTL